MNTKQVAKDLIQEELEALSTTERDLKDTKAYWEQALETMKREGINEKPLAQFMIGMCEEDLKEVEQKKKELINKSSSLFQEFAFLGIGDVKLDDESIKAIEKEPHEPQRISPGADPASINELHLMVQVSGNAQEPTDFL